jgi:hypothetical protein
MHSIVYVVIVTREGLGRFDSLRIGSKFCCMRSTPTAMQSMSENDFACLASTRVGSTFRLLLMIFLLISKGR